MSQQVGAFGYAMEFPVSGFPSFDDRKWKVIITRSDQSSFARLSDDDDVEIVDPTNKIMAVRIKDGDFSIPGAYQLQVWDVTDPEVSLRSSVRQFNVVESLTEPEPET